MAALVGDWLGDLASEGVTHIEAWTTEFHAQCECDTCRQYGQFFLEIKAICDAWLRVRGQYSDARLRINNSFRLPDEQMRKALGQIPPDVKIGRACFLRKRRHALRDCLTTIRALAKERGELLDMRQALFEPKLHRYFMVEARKAGARDLIPGFANWLESELGPPLE